MAPRYKPEEVTVDLVESQVTAVCTNPLWIDDSELCGQFSAAEALTGGGRL